MKRSSQKPLLRIWLEIIGVVFVVGANFSLSAQAQTNTFPTSGNAGVGTTSPASTLHVATESNDTTRGIVSSQHSDNANGSMFRFWKSRGTRTSPTSVANGDSLGLLYTDGYDGSAYVSGGRIKFIVDGAVSSGAVPTAVQFFSGNSGGGVERMRISSSGNVGIGTTNPNQTLGVQGMLGLYPQAWVAPTQRGMFMFHGGTGASIYAFNYPAGTGDPMGISAGTLAFQTYVDGSSYPRLFIANGGNVGIGTTSPTYPLDVQANNQWVARFKKTDATNGGILVDAAAGFNPNVAMSVNGTVKWYMNNNTSSGDALQFWESAGSYPRFTLTQAGNVGIGTPTPGYRIDVQGGQINSSGGLCIAGDCKTAWSQVGGGGSSQWTTTGSSNIYFNTGNVGIGNDSPLTKLHVSGATRVDGTSGKVYLGTSAVAGARGLEFIEENATTFSIRHHDPNVAWRNIAINPHGGSVGIGLTSPVYSLDVNGGVNGFRAKAATASSSDTIAAFENSSGVQAIVRGNGNVGIGTTNPQSNLQIGAQTSTSSASPSRLSLGGTYSNAAGTNFKLRLYDDGVAGNTYGLGVSVASMDFGVSPTAGYNWYSGGAHKMTLSGDGNLGIGTGATAPTTKLHVAGDVTVSGSGNINASGAITGGTIHAKYQDVAEWVESSQALEVGTVVVLDHTRSNQVIASSKAYDTRVAGVISLQPGIALGESGAGKVLVATTGRVKIKVDASAGPIQIGDLLVTSDVVGVAKKSEALNLGGVAIHRPGTLIGKALEPLAKGTGEILVLLSLQ